ncbi:MAG: hypothetical protein K6A64_08450 [Bacteroidales bacterium]|nr:hypothetical protein [Bacteroidales bacterium]
MSRVLIKACAIAAGLLFAALGASAQDNGTYSGYSPYSVYGVGPLHQAGTAYNRSMGGVGIASRNNRFVNILNPASITARDSLSFMADFGLDGRASIFNDGQYRSGNNLFNISDFVLSFPIYRHSAFMVGITPYSDVGYKFVDKDYGAASIAENGIRTSTYAGGGSVYQLFAGAAVTLWKRLSIGGEYIFYFGDIERSSKDVYSKSDVLGQTQSYIYQITGHSFKGGLQYEQPIGNDRLTFGATYLLEAPVSGYRTYSSARVISGSSETPSEEEVKVDGIRFGSEAGFGLAYQVADKYRFEVDYTMSDWKNSGFDAMPGLSNENFSSGLAHSFKAGVEYTPNRFDIRYYMKRVSYRAGIYYDQSYFMVNNQPVNDIGITVGATFPVFRWYNGLTVGLQAGQRGVAGSGMVRERYFGFSLGANIFDIWFQKPHYE